MTWHQVPPRRRGPRLDAQIRAVFDRVPDARVIVTRERDGIGFQLDLERTRAEGQPVTSTTDPDMV